VVTPFRGDLLPPAQRISFAYHWGGIGDFIHWTRAIEWSITEHPYIEGLIVTPPFFAELATLWLGRFAPRFRIHVTSDLYKDATLANEAMRVPSEIQLTNAGGAHMFNLGFAYFANLDRVPEAWRRLPVIRGDEADLDRFALPEERYVCITTNATSPSRELAPSTYNEIIEGVCARGLTPVFLGAPWGATGY
jgi:hypothetical protein